MIMYYVSCPRLKSSEEARGKIAGMKPRQHTEETPQTNDACVDICKTYACQIQLCLQKYQEQEKYCQIYIDQWKKCCDRVMHGGQASHEKGKKSWEEEYELRREDWKQSPGQSNTWFTKKKLMFLNQPHRNRKVFMKVKSYFSLDCTVKNSKGLEATRMNAANNCKFHSITFITSWFTTRANFLGHKHIQHNLY